MTRRPAYLWVAAIGLLALFVGAATAAAQGTEEERRACTPDAMRLCREYIPNVERIIACMEARRAELSPACQAFFKPAAPQPTAVAAAPAKPSRTATRAGAQKRSAARTSQTAAAKTAGSAGRKTPPRQAQTGPKKTSAPMNLLPAAGRPSPAKKLAPRDKQAQRTQ
jgi:hypothetical protein